MQIGFSNYMPTFSHPPGWDRQPPLGSTFLCCCVHFNMNQQLSMRSQREAILRKLIIL
jgi:hypothetical protein